MAKSYGLGFACFALLVAAASARQFRVGEQRGWSVPDTNVEPYNAWAGRMRFQIGDQLLFVYPKETDSVLLVERSAYDSCNASSYVQKFDDGSTVFTFNRSGPFFFISGNEANCRANEKLFVVVLVDRSGRAPPAVAPAPSMPPSIPTPPTSAPRPSPSSSPPSAAPIPAPAATPSSAPSPTASVPAPAPTTTPSSPPSPASLAPSPSPSPATPGGVPQPPSATGNAPGAEGPNSTNGQSGTAPVVAGFVTSLGACIGYAMLAI